MPWFAYQAWNMGSKSLEVCDYLGEKLAAFFGITTPKYQYVIDEYNRMIEMVSTLLFFLFAQHFFLQIFKL